MDISVEDAMSVREAAQLLGVTEKQVQHLGRRGEVRYVARGLLDGASVRAIQAARQGRHTRGWSGRTAWAAISLLSGHKADWLGQGQVSRLRSRMRTIGSDDLVASTRNRAVLGRFDGHQSAIGRISGDSRTVERRGLSGLVGQNQLAQSDWYIDARDEDHLVRTYGLHPSARGNFILRAVETADIPHRAGVTLQLVSSLMMDDVLTALDSAISDDPRERGVAMRALDDALDRFRRDV